MKISPYKFITTFCIVPVNDWSAFFQRIFYGFIIFRLVDFLKTPFFWVSFVALLTYSPDTIAWIFIKIGEIEMRVIGLCLSATMPEIFGTAGGSFTSWGQIWSAGLNALPTEVVQVMNALGVAQIMGMVTTTCGVVSSVRLYRAVMKRGGLL